MEMETGDGDGDGEGDGDGMDYGVWSTSSTKVHSSQLRL